MSYAQVLAATGQRPLSQILECRQLELFGRVARQPADSPMKAAAFGPVGLLPATDRYVRKVGRPRADRTTQVQRLAVNVAGGLHRLEAALQTEASWKACIDNHYRQ